MQWDAMGTVLLACNGVGSSVQWGRFFWCAMGTVLLAYNGVGSSV